MATIAILLADYGNPTIPAVIISVLILGLIFLLLTNHKRVFFDQRQNVSTSVIIVFSAIVPVFSVVMMFVKDPLVNAMQNLLITSNYLIIAAGAVLALVMRLLWIAEDKHKQENLKADAHWNSDEVWKIVKSAKHKIALYQTWFPDAAIIADRLANIFDTSENNVEIIIFQLHPYAEFGGERFRTINSDRLTSSEQDKLAARKAFFCQSVASIDNFIQRFENTENINVKIYTYKEDTHFRVYEIDETILCSEYKTGVSSTKSKPEIIWKKDRHKKDKETQFYKCQRVIKIIKESIKAEEPHYLKLPQQKGILKGDLYGSQYFH